MIDEFLSEALFQTDISNESCFFRADTSSRMFIHAKCQYDNSEVQFPA